MPAIFVSNFQDSGDDVMVFTETAAAPQLSARLQEVGASFDDCYEVPDDEQQFYGGDRCWLSQKNEAAILKNHPITP
jgi:hypothetical protein